jgi:thiol:disulfide interchange protein
MPILPLLALGLALLGAPAQDSRAAAEFAVRPLEGPWHRAAIRVQIDPGWHLYHDELGQPDSAGKPTKVTFPEESVLEAQVRFPEPHRFEQPGVGEKGRDTWIWGHEGEIVIHALLRVAEGTDVDSLQARLSGLTCQDDGSCIPWSAKPRNGGAGSDALFASFPTDLVPAREQASAATTAPADAPPDFTNDKAVAALYLRREGERLRAAIRIQIAPHYHLFHSEKPNPKGIGFPTVVTPSGAGITWSAARFPEPVRYDQSVIEPGAWMLGHEGEITVYLAGEAAAGAAADDVEVRIRGQVCLDDGECLLYTARLEPAGPGPDALFEGFPSDLAPGAEAPADGGSANEGPANGGAAAVGTTAVDWEAVTYPEYAVRDQPSERGLGMWLVFAFIAGVILNVMPCVLPVVSIKVLSFVQQAGESRRRIFELGLAFSAGILAVFLALAALAAFAGKGWGSHFQSQEFLVVMIAIVFGFSLSLFDVFEIGVPDQVGSLAAQRKEGVGDAFFKGMMATVLATPCSGPFLGSTLAWALTQPSTVVFLIFTFVGLGMAAPYVLLTAKPGFLKFVPKPGRWMQTFKHLMGFLLLGTVIFLMVSLRQDLHVYTVAFLVFVGLACWIWGRYATFDQSRLRRLGTVATVLLVLSLGAQASFVTLRNFFAGPGEGAGHLVWEDFDPVKLQRYHDEGRSVFVDFTADWCLTCKTNEKLVYESEEAVAALAARNVVAMRADETDDSPKTEAIARLRESLGARSIPFMAVFPGDDWRHPFTLKDLVTRAQFLGILEQLP